MKHIELVFDPDIAQKTFREMTRRMMSKRATGAIEGPGLELQSRRRQEMEARYQALRGYVPPDDKLEELPPSVTAEEVIEDWRKPTETTSTALTQKIPKPENGRAAELLNNKCEKCVGKGSLWTYEVMPLSQLSVRKIRRAGLRKRILGNLNKGKEEIGARGSRIQFGERRINRDGRVKKS